MRCRQVGQIDAAAACACICRVCRSHVGEAVAGHVEYRCAVVWFVAVNEDEVGVRKVEDTHSVGGGGVLLLLHQRSGEAASVFREGVVLHPVDDLAFAAVEGKHHQRASGLLVFQSFFGDEGGVAALPCYPSATLLGEFEAYDAGIFSHLAGAQIHDGERVLRHVKVFLLVDFCLARILEMRFDECHGVAGIGGEARGVAAVDGYGLAVAVVAQREDAVALLRVDGISAPSAVAAQLRDADALPGVEGGVVEHLLALYVTGGKDKPQHREQNLLHNQSTLWRLWPMRSFLVCM